MPLERNVPLKAAAEHFGCSVDLLRKYCHGHGGTLRPDRNKFEPILLEGEHWFRRGSTFNAPIILKLAACEQTLSELGYYDPGADKMNKSADEIR